MRCSVQPTLGGVLSFTTHLSRFLLDRRRGYPFFSWGGGHKGEVCESASNPLRGYLPQHTRSPKPKNLATLLIVPRCVNSSNALSINCPASSGPLPPRLEGWPATLTLSVECEEQGREVTWTFRFLDEGRASSA